MASPTHIVITGAMGVGKTTIGRLLAQEVGMPFLDSDELLEARTGETGAEIAARDGVPRLHELELAVFLEMCRSEESSVMAPAASVIDQEAGRVAMTENFTIWLTAPDEVVAQRQGLEQDGHRRPVDAAERAVLSRRRNPWLEEVNSLTFDTSIGTPAENVRALIELLPAALRS